MVSLHVTLSLLVAALGCSSGESRSATPKRDEKTGTAPASPTFSSASEAWRLEVPGASPRGIVALTGGAVTVAWSLPDKATIAGAPYQSRGDLDIVVTVVDATGAARVLAQLGGPGEEDLEAIIPAPDGIYVGLTSSGSITLGGKVFAPPAMTPNVFAPSYSALVVRIALDGTIVSAWTAFSNRANLQLATLANGDVIATSIRTEDDGSNTIVRRFSGDGTLRWEKKYSGYRVSRVQALGPDRIVASVEGTDPAGGDRIGLWWIDVKAGEVTEKLEIQKPKLTTGDLGGIAGMGGAGADLCAFGETGGNMVLNGKAITRPSYAMQPFMLALGTPGPTLVDVEDATGDINGVGTIGSRPAAQVHVIHTGADKSFHRGEYVVIGCSASRKLIPIYQYRYENDDWEHAPAQHVAGKEIHASRAAFADDHVFLAGRSTGGSGAPGCVAKIMFAR